MDYIHEHNIIHLDLKVSECQFRDKIESTFFSLSLSLSELAGKHSVSDRVGQSNKDH